MSAPSMVDSHCHLADEVFADDLADVVGRARASGLVRVMCIVDAGSPVEAERARGLAGQWEGVRFAVGVHPHRAGEWVGRLDEVASVVGQGIEGLPGVVAVGEIGLDYHYDFSPREVQHEVLRCQLEVAVQRRLPVVIHAREADADVLQAIASVGKGSLRGVFHCFTGSVAMARRVVDAGLHVGIGGIVTFPKGENVREVVRALPLDRLLIETDSPYLAPVPHRGRRNEPSWVVHVAERIASELQVSRSTVAEVTTAAFADVFGA